MQFINCIAVEMHVPLVGSGGGGGRYSLGHRIRYDMQFVSYNAIEIHVQTVLGGYVPLATLSGMVDFLFLL